MPTSVRRPSARLGAWLPHGGSLSDEDWSWRHSAVCLLLALHVPVLVAVAVLTDHRDEVWQALVPLALLLAGARLARLSRTLRSLCASAGLLTCSAHVVHLADEATEAHFHFFVVVAVIALYQDWAVYALAVGFVFLHHAFVVANGHAPGDVESWGWAVLHAGAVGVLSAVLVLFWRAHEMSRLAADRARAELSDGQDSVRARIDATEQMREDLIGTVSHEFRTPLTGIKGAALTLLKKGDRLDSARRESLLRAVLAHEERLSRLLENMLLASEATAVDPRASTDVEDVANAVAAESTTPVSVVVEPGLTAHIDRNALRHVLAHLVENAAVHGASGTETLVAGGLDDGRVWLRVSNEGRVLDLTDKDHLFRPFTQVDSSVRREREGIGVGLYLVHRLVQVYGGTVDVDSHSGWVTVEVRLRPGDSAPTAAAAPRPRPVTVPTA